MILLTEALSADVDLAEEALAPEAVGVVVSRYLRSRQPDTRSDPARARVARVPPHLRTSLLQHTNTDEALLSFHLIYVTAPSIFCRLVKVDMVCCPLYLGFIDGRYNGDHTGFSGH